MVQIDGSARWRLSRPSWALPDGVSVLMAVGSWVIGLASLVADRKWQIVDWLAFLGWAFFVGASAVLLFWLGRRVVAEIATAVKKLRRYDGLQEELERAEQRIEIEVAGEKDRSRHVVGLLVSQSMEALIAYKMRAALIINDQLHVTLDAEEGYYPPVGQVLSVIDPDDQITLATLLVVEDPHGGGRCLTRVENPNRLYATQLHKQATSREDLSTRIAAFFGQPVKSGGSRGE